MKIKVKILSRSLRETIVEPKCRKALKFCQIAGTTYLNTKQLFLIERLNFEIEIIDD